MTSTVRRTPAISMRAPLRRVVAAVSLLAFVALVAAGCGGGGGSGSSGPTIALLLPENQTARYETHDRPDFEKRVKALCSNCNVLYSNAAGDATNQQNDADAALTQGAKVLVLDPVDAASAGSIVAKANAQNVPVISYDRLITNSDIDYYVSFDNTRVGRLQGQSLSAKLKSDGKPNGPIIMLNGDPADSNAAQFKAGALSAFKANNVQIAKQYDTPGYTGANAQNEAQQAITALGNNGFAGIYGANDDIAGGAISAMKSAGITPASRPTTGQDASVAGIQRILTGEQYMSVYKAVTKEAQIAAEIAVPVAKGNKPPAGLVTTSTNNGKKKVPSVLLTPVALTKSNIESTVIKDHFWTPAQICTAAFKAACQAAGIGTTSAQPAAVKVANSSLGKILVDAQGHTLYLFTKDSGTTSECTGMCATAWPPLMDAGGQQVTRNGHPLYRFVKDTKPGDVNGEGLTAFGGSWFAVSPAGNRVSPPAPKASPPAAQPAPAPAPKASPPPASNSIPQNGGGDGDADNNGGPDDGDGGV
jgi:D-xylose transport system substrate-binding protein